MKKRTSIVISTIILIAILIGCFPLSALAAENDANPLVPVPEVIDPTHIGEHDGKVVELESLREENVKHFRLPDGTYEAVSYENAVHRKNSDGVWVDIDNNLSLNTANLGTAKLATVYSTPDSRLKFSKDFVRNSNIVTIQENDYTIGIGLLSQQNDMALETETISTTRVTNSSNQRMAFYDDINSAASINNQSSIVYENALPNVDIEYVAIGNDLKENIILKSASCAKSYSFILGIDGLTAELVNNSINLKDINTGEIKYVIPAPYMYDSIGNISYNVSYQLTYAGANKYILSVTADDEWITSEERVYPVTIDPTIQTTSAVWDTYIDSAYPTQNYGNDDELWISSTATALIRINIPNLPSSATFNYANLYVNYYYHITTGAMSVGAYKIAGSWSEYSVTYNSSPTISSTQLSSYNMLASSSITESSPGTATFSITDAVSGYYHSGGSFNGIALKRISGSNASVILKSYEAGTSHRAYIRINYSHYIPDGVYALENLSRSTWMSVEQSSNNQTAVGNNIQHTTAASSISAANKASLFKITRVGTTQRYIVRSMLDNNFTFKISGTEVVVETIPLVVGQVSASQTFYIEWNGTGYTLCPYSNSNYIIYSSSMSDKNLTAVAKSTYATNLAATWNLIEYPVHEMSLQVICDNAYLERFANASTLVNESLAVLQEKYLLDFNIWIDTSSLSSYRSVADLCGDKDSACSHVGNSGCYNSTFYDDGRIIAQSLHHKNIYNMFVDINNRFSSEYDAIMCFTGHKLCWVNKQGVHEENTSYGLHVPYFHLTMIMGENDPSKIYNNLTVVHEFGHLYGAPDHYDAYVDPPSSNDLCIYGDYRDNCLSSLTMCTACQASIRSNLSRYD